MRKSNWFDNKRPLGHCLITEANCEPPWQQPMEDERKTGRIKIAGDWLSREKKKKKASLFRGHDHWIHSSFWINIIVLDLWTPMYSFSSPIQRQIRWKWRKLKRIRGLRPINVDTIYKSYQSIMGEYTFHVHILQSYWVLFKFFAWLLNWIKYWGFAKL